MDGENNNGRHGGGGEEGDPTVLQKAFRELADMMSTKISDFLTPSPLVCIWN